MIISLALKRDDARSMSLCIEMGLFQKVNFDEDTGRVREDPRI